MPAWLRRVAVVIAHPFADRERRRTTITLFVVMIAYAMQYARAWSMHFKPHGDGFFSWSYATSMAFDFDLDLTNDYRLCGRGDMVIDEGGGRPSNPFYFGPAMIWAPILLVLRVFVRLPAGAADTVKHACAGPYVKMVGATSIFFTALTLWIAYRVARRWVSQPYGLVGILVGAFGTTLVTYGAPMWFYSHLWSALGVACVMLAFVRATEKPQQKRRWYVFGLSVAFAALMRPQEAGWVIVAVVWAIAILLRERKIAALRSVVAPAAMSALGFASLYWVQLLVYKKLYGVWWLVPQGKLYVQLGHAHPFLMMFSNYSGWFTWTPLAWLGVIGGFLMLIPRSSRLFGVAMIVGCSVDTYLASSVLSWAGGGTWGMRTMTSLVPAVVIGAAYGLQAVGEWLVKRRDRVRFVLGLALVFPFLFMAWGNTFVPPAVTREPLGNPYGAAVTANFKDFSKDFGNPFVLPASQVFSWRYRLPRTKFEELAFTGYFVRHYRTLETYDNIVTFASPKPELAFAEGIVADKEGARISGGRGRFLVTIYWPWVTHLKLAIKLNEPKETTVKLRARGFVFGKDLGSMVYAPGREELEWTLPPNGLDSGINEIIVEADGDITLKTLEFIDRTKHDLSLK